MRFDLSLFAAHDGRGLSGGLVLLSVLLTVAVARAEDQPVQSVEPDHAERRARGLEVFKKDVRGILANRCLTCHGGDDVQGGFNLATRELLLKGGDNGAAIESGKAKSSRLFKLIAHAEQPHMPYDEDKLPEAEIARIAEWIDLGAPYDKPLAETVVEATDWRERGVPESAREFWSFQPLAAVEPPPVKDESWCRNDIDRFILARLEAAGIAPNPEADRRTLLRRASYGLIGLPPTPHELEAFVDSADPEAYEQLIDRLLANEHFGERWARHWLDVARFAESHGFEQDYDRPYAYHYRDFVIQAFNSDMPYDQFVRWQLAGDEFAPGEPLAMMATGFLGAGVFPTQITANEVERTRYDALDDMAATTGTAFLGLTVGCARCHDHKFDPIPQADYYRFVSTFTTTVRSNIELDLKPEETRRRLAEWERQHQPLADALQAFERDQLPGRFVKWLDEAEQLEGAWRRTTDWIVLQPEKIESEGGATFKPLADGSFLVEGKNPDQDTFTITGRFPGGAVRAIRVEALSAPSLPQSGPGRAPNGNFGLSEISVALQPPAPTPCTPEDRNAPPRPVPLGKPRATFQQNDGNLAVAASLDGKPQTGWAVDPQFGKDHAAVFEVPAADVEAWQEPFAIRLQFAVNKQHAIGRLRVSVSLRESPPLDGRTLPQNVAAALDRIEGTGSAQLLEPAEHQALVEWYKRQDAEWVQLNEPVQQSLAEKPEPELTQVMVASEGFTPIRHHTQGADFFEETYFLKRGDCDQKDGVAEPGVLQVLMQHPEGFDHWQQEPSRGWRTSYRRRSLANWITDTEHGPGHLLARVIVNRLWHHHFGRGLVATPNDFGTQGERPSHPELLDWLAAQLIENGWRLKPIHKLIMSSAAYRQSSEFDEAKSKADPLNALVWRFAPRRLEAEIIRDAMLAASGMLDRTMYGPGTLDEGHTRRSIYFMIKRSKLIPMLVIFDTPEPLVSVGRRPATTIAPQALVFLNNEHVRGWVKNFASRLAPAAERSLEEAVVEGYRIAVARQPTESELRETVAFLERQQASYASAAQANPRELALADFCQVLVSLNEFVYVD